MGISPGTSSWEKEKSTSQRKLVSYKEGSRESNNLLDHLTGD